MLHNEVQSVHGNAWGHDDSAFPLGFNRGLQSRAARSCCLCANRQRIANFFPTAPRLLFVGSDRQRLAYSGARPILPLGVSDASSVPAAV
jgi:hypothetical protein